jgi:hypothetical protein
MIRTALFSQCGRFRYRLGRRWAEGPTVAFVLLNPSAADAYSDDPTVRRCVDFARRWGYGALAVVNLYAYVATDPEDLRRGGTRWGRRTTRTSATVRSATRSCWRGACTPRPGECCGCCAISGSPLTACVTAAGHPEHPLRLAKTCGLHYSRVRVVLGASRRQQSDWAPPFVDAQRSTVDDPLVSLDVRAWASGVQQFRPLEAS